MFAHIQELPADPILGLSQLFAKDTNPNKVDLGVGVYRDNSGKTPIMRAVKTAENLLLVQQTSKAYLSSLGNNAYRSAISKLVLGQNSDLYATGRIAVAQTPAGTGALHLAFEFIKTQLKVTQLWLSNPTWGNHKKIASAVGLQTNQYAYVDQTSNTFEFGKLLKDLEQIPAGDAVLFHAACHNPTGFDPSLQQWEQISDIALQKKFVVILDSAYQGLGDGLEEDAKAIALLAEKLPFLFIATSSSKNFGLYRDRIGALLIKTANATQTQNIESHLASIVRGNFSSPPDHGAAIVAQILQSQDLTSVWQEELQQMRTRTKKLRNDFRVSWFETKLPLC